MAQKVLYEFPDGLRAGDAGGVQVHDEIIATQGYADQTAGDAVGNVLALGSVGLFNIVVPYDLVGNVSTGTKKLWMYPFLFPADITACYAKVGTAPASQPILIDVNINGTTIFTTQSNRITIPATETFGQGVPEVTTLAAADVISIDIDQVGSGTVGANLTVTITINPLSSFVS
jgi:hypothetical protein